MPQTNHPRPLPASGLRPDLYTYRLGRKSLLSQCRFWRNLGDSKRHQINMALHRRRYLSGHRAAMVWHVTGRG